MNWPFDDQISGLSRLVVVVVAVVAIAFGVHQLQLLHWCSFNNCKINVVYKLSSYKEYFEVKKKLDWTDGQTDGLTVTRCILASNKAGYPAQDAPSTVLSLIYTLPLIIAPPLIFPVQMAKNLKFFHCFLKESLKKSAIYE